MPVAKIVSVLRRLLEPKRRFALSICLHKSLLRVLFDCATRDASALFLTEWSDREQLKLHVDIQHDMVWLCVQCVSQEVSADKRSKIARQIFEEVAADATVPSETQLLLLLPTWTPTLPFVSEPFSSGGAYAWLQGCLTSSLPTVRHYDRTPHRFGGFLTSCIQKLLCSLQLPILALVSSDSRTFCQCNR